MAITDKKISTVYNGRDIASLSDRPNADGMSASDLKARFDQLGKEIIPKLNALIDELFADLYSGTSQAGHTHNLDNLVDGITYKLFTALERAKLSAIAENAEVNQNAFSNVKVGSTTIASSVKTDTLELVAGLNVLIAVDALTKKITLSATGDLATEAVQSYIEDIGNYFTSLNVEGALQEVGAKLSPSSSKVTPIDADTILLSDSADSNIFKKLTWANIKATLKAYFDTIYQAILVSGTSIKTINSTDVLGSGNIAVQPTLVSGTNIKTINGNSVLGGGDIPTMLPKNWVINGMFDVWQRSTSQTTSGYGSDDRWINEHGGSTKTHSQQVFTIGQTNVPNNPKYFSRTIVSSVAGASNYVAKVHRIEDVTKLAGKTISVSFWAKADANKNISIEFRQNFGTGGSTSVSEIGVQKFALTTSWQRFTKLVTLPSVVGKTIASDSYLQMTIWFEAGSNFNLRTDSLGHQSGTFDIANVSLVEGSVAVECQNQPYADVLRECQRYYERGFVGASGLSAGTTEGYLFVRFKTDKRVLPTISVIAGSSLASCISEIAVAERTPTSLVFERDINHVRIVTVGATYSANGRLIVFRFDIIQADAEL